MQHVEEACGGGIQRGRGKDSWQPDGPLSNAIAVANACTAATVPERLTSFIWRWLWPPFSL